MPSRRRLLECTLVLAMLPLSIMQPSRAAGADEFPVPSYSRFT